MSRKITRRAVGAVAGIACAFVIVASVLHTGALVAPLAVIVGILGTYAAFLALLPPQPRGPAPLTFEKPDWVVDRPDELGDVVKALMRAGGKAGTTTVLSGAGGFGKSMLAELACADSRVRRRFGGGVHKVTVGPGVQSPAKLAEKVNGLIGELGGEEAGTEPKAAGDRLESLLNERPRRLLVLDDIWDDEQLAPFTRGGKRCARLVTTRKPELPDGPGTVIRVERMSPRQARKLLTNGLPPLGGAAGGE